MGSNWRRCAKGQWERSADILAAVALKLEHAGADFIVICTNTMHKIVPQIQKKITIPIIHIADATAEKLKEHEIHKVALLCTKYTMTQNFYKDSWLHRNRIAGTAKRFSIASF